MSQDVFCKSESEVTGSKGISAFKVFLLHVILNLKIIVFIFTAIEGGRSFQVGGPSHLHIAR